ncbi:flagellar basal body-associated FliL family protein [Desulfovibrio sp. TomC]|uniref:flagellar basal body-associated FliL family protein n=1 Tax=Desulfovibrio sp. TomC TaxID=1562888 RepID=UPI0005731F26|nr:flagellar basal body-associated FliL family protein [Desulfovibrio sp. TomC]KHK03002.1 Flagellar biosynthesis protein FliL [Desulfovibrio sp. TomC]
MADVEEPVEGKKKKSGLIKYIILVLLLLLLGGGGYFAYLKFFAAKPPAAATAEGAAPAGEAPKAEAAPHEAKPEEKKAEGGHGEAKGGEAKGGHGGKDKAASNNVPLPAFVVNLADANARRYLKVVLEVEMTGNPELLEGNQAKIRDALLMLLSSKTSQDLSTLEGKILLRKEIVDRLNQAIGQPKVSRVYFTDFVIQ